MSQERIQELELALIVTDDELKVRVEIDPRTAQDYYDAMETEEEMRKFPKPTVYFDGCRYWLADGQHRYWAAFRRGYKSMAVNVVEGSHDEAILAAVKLNLNHGLRFQEGDFPVRQAMRSSPMRTSPFMFTKAHSEASTGQFRCGARRN